MMSAVSRYDPPDITVEEAKPGFWVAMFMQPHGYPNYSFGRSREETLGIALAARSRCLSEQRIVPARPRRDAAVALIERTRNGETVPALATGPNAAEGVAAAVGGAMERALGSLAPYGSRGDVFEAAVDVEHVDQSGSTTRARVNFKFVGGTGR